MSVSRREFLRQSVVTGGTLAALGAAAAATPTTPETPAGFASDARPSPPAFPLPDLRPARWIWYPSERTLPNSFVLFRRTVSLRAKPRRATGWICADSRYRLALNGRRIQWGPPPSDPRWAEADPLDLTEALQAGENVLGATVLFFGHGDGTAPLGKPGFLFWLELDYGDGAVERIVSDDSWRVLLCRAWQPGHYKRWYLRSLQEEFDARAFPYGWDRPDFTPSSDWLSAMPLDGSPNRPALSTGYYEYSLDTGRGPADTELRPRSIPLLQETEVPAVRLTESHWLEWKRPVRDYFEFLTPAAFDVVREASARAGAAGQWTVAADGRRGAVLTFELAEQVVGWPHFAIDAPAGTVVELLVHEGHDPFGPGLANSHFNSWSRFICREGRNEFETFDFESLRWLQLHIHATAGEVSVSGIGVRRRMFPWPHAPEIRTAEPALQRLFDAAINTLHNCAQETLVDGMARERQQYSGDGGHQLHAVHLAFGEARLPARYLQTWSQGLTKDGFFLDCWPAFDRLSRLPQRQLDLSDWGPIVDHGVGFMFDCWHHYSYTGDFAAVEAPLLRLLRFTDFLRSLRCRDGLLAVENLGVPVVWMDVDAYTKQRHKQCAFNLYAAAALQHALAPLCRAAGDARRAETAVALGEELLAAARRAFWDPAVRAFVSNRPWLDEEKARRYCDRSLATAVLFDQCPQGDAAEAVRLLATCPPEMGLSYPCNAGWRLWALAKAGRVDTVLRDYRERWATMDSVRLNNTLQEGWKILPDTFNQWSHCCVAPLFVTLHGLVGLRPLEPGFKRLGLKPQLADLAELAVTAHTAVGPVRFHAQGRAGERTLDLEVPAGCAAEIQLRASERVALVPLDGESPAGWRRYQLPPGTTRLTGLTLA